MSRDWTQTWAFSLQSQLHTDTRCLVHLSFVLVIGRWNSLSGKQQHFLTELPECRSPSCPVRNHHCLWHLPIIILKLIFYLNEEPEPKQLINQDSKGIEGSRDYCSLCFCLWRLNGTRHERRSTCILLALESLSENELNLQLLISIAISDRVLHFTLTWHAAWLKGHCDYLAWK